MHSAARVNVNGDVIDVYILVVGAAASAGEHAALHLPAEGVLACLQPYYLGVCSVSVVVERLCFCKVCVVLKISRLGEEVVVLVAIVE